MSKDLKDELMQAVVKSSDAEPHKPLNTRLKNKTCAKDVHVKGNLKIVNNITVKRVNIDKRKAIKIPDSTLKELMDKIKSIAD